MKTAIITDTNSGMLPSDAEEHGIVLLPMPIIAINTTKNFASGMRIRSAFA